MSLVFGERSLSDLIAEVSAQGVEKSGPCATLLWSPGMRCQKNGTQRRGCAGDIGIKPCRGSCGRTVETRE